MQDRHSVLVLTCRYYCLPILLILHRVQSNHVLLLHTHCFSIRCTMLLTMFWGPLVLLRKLRELKTILQGKSNWQPTTHEMKHKNDFQWVTLEAGRLRIPGSCCNIICRLSFSLLWICGTKGITIHIMGLYIRSYFEMSVSFFLDSESHM